MEKAIAKEVRTMAFGIPKMKKPIPAIIP